MALSKNGILVYFENDITPSFGLTDLKELSAGFDKTYLFTEVKIGKKVAIPESITVVEEYLDWKNFKPYETLRRNWYLLAKITLKEWIIGGIKGKHILSFIKKTNTNIFKAQSIMNELIRRNIATNKITLYSFWFYDCIFQAILKMQNRNFISLIRTHSGDLYEDAPSMADRPLGRNFQLKYTDGCYCISKMGMEYLKIKYPKYAYKIHCSRLGTVNTEILNPFSGDRFVLVSCSHVRNVKRVHLIAEALQLVDFELDWYHFGETGEPNSQDVFIEYFHKATAKLKKKTNVHYHQMGNIPLQEVYKLYSTTPVNLMISTSSTEGIPVSMMEAISFGIPLLGTDVGGCSEIINEETGMLMPANIEPMEIANKLFQFKNSTMNSSNFRDGVRKYWEKNYSQEVNYKSLLQQLEVNN